MSCLIMLKCFFSLVFAFSFQLSRYPNFCHSFFFYTFFFGHDFPISLCEWPCRGAHVI